MGNLTNVFAVLILGASAVEDLNRFLDSAQQAEIDRVESELKVAQRSAIQARHSRGGGVAASTKARQDDLRRELRAVKAGAFALPRLRPEKLAAGAVGLLYDPAPYESPPRPRARTVLDSISRQNENANWYKMPWNSFRVARILSAREFIAAGRGAEFVVRGLETAALADGQTGTLPQVVRVVAPHKGYNRRLPAVEVLDSRPAAAVLQEWARKGKKPKAAPRSPSP